MARNTKNAKKTAAPEVAVTEVVAVATNLVVAPADDATVQASEVALTTPEVVVVTEITTPAPAGAEVITTVQATSKAAKAREIFDECYQMNPVPARKDIINRAVKEAGLTKPGAATYLQNYKAKAGLSVKRAVAA